MATSTRQITTNRGQDTAASTRTQTTSGTSTRNARPQSSTQKQHESPLTTTQITRPAARDSVESSDPQSIVTTEDHAFTLQFTVPLDGAVPCEPPTV